jgi:hypothetical protein
LAALHLMSEAFGLTLESAAIEVGAKVDGMTAADATRIARWIGGNAATR